MPCHVVVDEGLHERECMICPTLWYCPCILLENPHGHEVEAMRSCFTSLGVNILIQFSLERRRTYVTFTA